MNWFLVGGDQIWSAQLVEIQQRMKCMIACENQPEANIKADVFDVLLHENVFFSR